MQRFLWVAKPIRRYGPPKTSRRRRIFEVVNSSYFEYLVIFVILFNVFAMSITYHNMDHHLEQAIDMINSICTLFFLLEVAIKVLALTPANYFRVRSLLGVIFR